jgi:hypothetical protein
MLLPWLAPITLQIAGVTVVGATGLGEGGGGFYRLIFCLQSQFRSLSVPTSMNDLASLRHVNALECKALLMYASEIIASL